MIVSYGDHPDQLIEFFGDDGPLVALIHGGYWRSIHTKEHMQPLAEQIAALGFRVANLEYRRIPNEPYATLVDLNLAFEKLPTPAAVIGFSVGGQLALISKHKSHKIILLAPVTDLERTKAEHLGDGAVNEFFGDQDLADFDPMKRNYEAHLFIIHGDEDQRVPLAHSRDFAKAKGAALMEISGADHMALVAPEGLSYDLIKQTLLYK